MTSEKEDFTLIEAILPILFLTAFLSFNVFVFGDAALDGSNQIVLLVSAAVAVIIAMLRGFSWDEVQAGMLKSINSTMPSILILLMIGAISGSWLVSGIVPAMIYYGILMLNPDFFLAAACVVCAVVSVATGSSWTTAATVGVALIGIGQTMGIHTGMVAGAILSGAYFGDKMSPLSDTTNLAPAMAGTDLFTHIKYMSLTTIPSIVVTLIIFIVLGLTAETNVDATYTLEVLSIIDEKFNINLGLFVVPIIVVVMIAKKVPALPSLFVGSILAILVAILFQKPILQEVSGLNSGGWEAMFVGAMKSVYGGIAVTTSNEMVNDLLSSGGMYGMLNTVWLIISAIIFGGVMEGTGMLRKIVTTLMSGIKSTGSLIAATAGTCTFFNFTASDQYLAIVVPGRMYADKYRNQGLAPENLSRTLEDSGTVTSVLVPWNTCGAYHAGVLGVTTGAFIPYCFFNIISPLMTIAFGYLNFKIRRLNADEVAS
ncbi:Na+/H+ antiporter NhaC [Reichenbachiella versicolor]|uniref:Na+/H+ antiporter NhaC n=1 Tax=Reichenbachiella versicolor TaxID=1821036 RepID=UPI000D6E3587|nr:Na+/H+ antiporter NhaC [Reichenbachiella versicolor]